MVERDRSCKLLIAGIEWVMSTAERVGQVVQQLERGCSGVYSDHVPISDEGRGSFAQFLLRQQILG